MLYEDLTYKIRGACFNVYNELGSGFKESVYHKALSKEFLDKEIKFEIKKRIPIEYKDEIVGVYEPDFIVEDKVILEIKAVPVAPKQYENQLFYYLRCTNYKLGFLVNFGSDKLDIRRRIYDQARSK